jgi:putative Mg2+ transporter-C (MgtC) family protein
MSLSPETWKILQQIGVAYGLTVAIGWDREREAHSTGVRTFPIVGMASCGFLLVLGNHPEAGDQSRLLQGLITGIGFLGAGAILKQGINVHGSATAASVWNAAVIGAAVALERYDIAIILAVLNLFTLRALLPLKNWIDQTRDGKRPRTG